jgi:hypothetical protein
VTDSTPAKETRTVIIGVIAVVVLVVGYCGVKAVQFGRAAAGMAQRVDTTFHVVDGSAVYLDKAPIAGLARVIVIHGDTGQAATRSVTAALHHQMVMYTAGAATDSTAAARVAAMPSVYGMLYGRYDGTDPVRIELTEGMAPPTTIPDGMLTIRGRQKGIPLYLSPKP